MPAKDGKSRKQIFLPNCIDDYVEPYSPVRVIDLFVDTLDLKALGFKRAVPASTGRPSYAPGDLLKLYIYGYMNKMRSSRRLMTECRRNMEVMFLLNELTPDFRTISDFRKDNPEPIREVFREFTKFCSDHGLYKKELIAIDGTKVRAQNAGDKCYNKDILLKKLERIETATDAGSHLICEYEVTSGSNDLGNLTFMAESAKTALGEESIAVVADKGYDSRDDILDAIMHGVTPDVAMKHDKDERLYNLPYEYADVTDAEKNSVETGNIMKCLKAGVLPNCLDERTVSVEVQRIADIACFTRIDEKQVRCPMGKTLRFVKRRRGRQTIFRSYEACRTCDNRCKASANAKEVCFADGVKHVPVRMYGDRRKTKNHLPSDYVPPPNSRAL
ncbi:MAG: transposase [Clostridiales Family XIII bacterium]|jgi:transposase|nr:transposase [Clostridiales Family XIII bacterium]